MSSISNLIGYFKDCYQADTRTISFNSLFAKKVENRFFLDGKDELLNGNLSAYPISEKYYEAVEKNLLIYKREKVFYCAAFSIIGKGEGALGAESTFCAPLFLYPAKLVRKNSEPFVEITFEKRIININFLNSLKSEEVDDIHEVLTDQIPTQFSDDITTVGQIARLLEKRLPHLDAGDALLYPDLVGEKNLKQQVQKKSAGKGQFRLMPTLAFCVLRRSTSTQGIITELSSLTKHLDYSAPLRYLLGNKSNVKATKLGKGIVPTILSESQNDILSAVNKEVCTLVIGPPGTGKSYSIAALALDFMSKNKSVLIASKTDEAVDIISKKIEVDLNVPNIALRAGSSDYKKKLKGELENLLATTRRRPKGTLGQENFKLSNELNDTSRAIVECGEEFEDQVENEGTWGKYVAEAEANASFFAKIKVKYVKWRNSLQLPHWEVSKNLLDAYDRYKELAREVIVGNFNLRVHQSLYSNRILYRNFLKSLTARHSSRQEMLFDQVDVGKLLGTFPIWLVNMSDVHGVFPLRKEAFDLAIIDEATQCDIASCLPIFQRAKRVVVVGDPKQLRHASFLSRSMQFSLQKKHEIQDDTNISLDYRVTSILDLVEDQIERQDQVCFLDEHYRSKPDLIRFSNKHFYNDNLRIMTDSSLKNQGKNRELVEVEGVRDKKGVNRKEARAVIKEIKRILRDQKDLSAEVCQSIGVLSPFRDQVEFIATEIQSVIDLQAISKHQISCGTAYSFQGDERDIMLISMAVDSNSHHSTLIHMNKPDVFNVSITRARTKQVVFISFPKEFDAGLYVNHYLSDIRNDEQVVKVENSEAKDLFANEVKKRLEEMGMQVWVRYSISGLLVDLVFKTQDRIFGINLIGYPGEFEGALEIEDYKVLIRAGLPTFPMPYTYWKFGQDRCFEELMQFAGEGVDE